MIFLKSVLGGDKEPHSDGYRDHEDKSCDDSKAEGEPFAVCQISDLFFVYRNGI